MNSAVRPYDGILLDSFGGPETADEVMPFLRHVTRGRNVPEERLRVVGEHYFARGGRSPINDENRALVEALTTELTRRGHDLPVIWGNRHSQPFTAEALQTAVDRGWRRVLVITTSAYSSYSSCRQYREDLAAARAEVRAAGHDIVVDKVRPYAHHPGFSVVNARLTTDAVRGVLPDDPAPTLLFVTHSIPEAMDETSGPGDGAGRLYSRQHLALVTAITSEVKATLGTELVGELVFCSRSGPPGQPWLEPDINDRIEQLAAEGVTTVVVVPIGFVSDHMEVVHDLDTEAAATAAAVGVRMVRVATVGRDPEFVHGLVDLVEERAAEARGEHPVPLAWPVTDDIRPSVCAAGCCPNLRHALPAICGVA